MAKNRLGRKGVFLTLIAISLIAAFVIVFTPSKISLEKGLSSVKTRIAVINDFVVDLEEVYLVKTLESSSTKAVLSLIEYMEAQNEFVADFDGSFEEILLYGTINNVPIDSQIPQPIMEGNTYLNWTSRVANISKNAFNIKTQISVAGVEAMQTQPWFLTVKAEVSFNVSSETASWAKNLTVVTNVDIQRFDDPYYLVNTQGSYRNRINRSTVKLGQWFKQNVTDHLKYGTYTHLQGSKAPNFIMRFTNTSSNSSCCGIESLVDPNKLAKKDQFESYADFLFFNHSFIDRCDLLYNITSPEIISGYSSLKLDFRSLVIYNLTAPFDSQPCE
jgi:hypothetical protein